MNRLFPALAVCLLLGGAALRAGPAALPAVPVALPLEDPSGHAVEPLASKGQKATVLFFLTTECPVGNGYAPEIARIVRDYRQQGVVCYGIYAGEKPAEITRHLHDYRLPLTALLDPERHLAKLTGATVTPEACILSPGGEMLYRGRIDDRAIKPGTVRVEPRVRDLRLALEAVLSGKPVALKFTKAIGCYLAPPAAPR